MAGEEVTMDIGAERVRLDDAHTPSPDVAGVDRGPSARSRLRWVPRALVIGDAASFTAAFVGLQAVAANDGTGHVVPTILTGAVIWVIVFTAFGLYGMNGLSRPAVFDEIRHLVGATAAGSTVVVIAGAAWGRWPSAVWLAGLMVTALALELCTRWAIRTRIRKAKRAGVLAMRTILVGSNEEARSLGSRLLAPGGWFLPVGLVTSADDRTRLDGIATVGELEELEQAIQHVDADCVFVASTAVSADDVLEISRSCRRTGTELRMSVNVKDVLSSRLAVQSADGVTAITFKPVRPTRGRRALKRGVDIGLGSLSLVVAAPVLLLIAAAIAVTSKGPVLFRQDRVTKGGKVFTIYKFRTMVQDVERALDGKVIDLTQPFFKLENDPRLTRVGRFLRSYSLDELPQLLNVIRGDMSMVGPRPLPADQVAANAEFLRPRHEVRAGLTGLWQISGRSDLESEEALRMDRFYIENWSLSLDLYILLQTVVTVLTRRGAY